MLRTRLLLLLLLKLLLLALLHLLHLAHFVFHLRSGFAHRNNQFENELVQEINKKAVKDVFQ